MSSTTSDERRMVAARLRKAVKEHLYSSSDLGESIAAEVNCYGHPREKVFTHLADLIDPTCQEIPMESVGRWPFYTGIDMHLEKVSYGCSVCGYPWGEIDKWATHGADWLHSSPKYCPNCGRRIVKE